MDKRWLLLPLGFVLLLVALRWSQSRAEPFRVSGFIEADEIRVGSRVGGRVARVHVDEGAVVAGGETLVELEPFDLSERHAEQAARAKALEARLAELRAGPRHQEIEAARARLAAARAGLSLAELDEERTRSLVADSIRSREALDRAQAVLEAARADGRAAEEALGLLEEGTRKEELAAAEAQVAAAEAGLRALERAQDELVIRAPGSAGAQRFTVEACELEPGDLVAANAAVVSLRDQGELRVRAYVPQDRLTFTVGAPAWVGVDAFPGRRFRAHVDFVAPSGEFTPSNVQTPEERSEVVVRVRVTLEEGQELLRPGVAADVWFHE